MYFVKKRELAENLKNSCFDIAENCEIYNKTEKKKCAKNQFLLRRCSFKGLALQARSHENSPDLAYIATFVPWMCKKLP